jgi:hypothetical protein
MKRTTQAITLVLAILLLSLERGRAQSQEAAPALSPREEIQDEASSRINRAVETLHYLAGLVGGFKNPEQRVVGWGVVSEALALQDVALARDYLRQAWAMLEKLTAEERPKGPVQVAEEQARQTRLRDLRTELLSRARRIDSALARELANPPKEANPKTDPPSNTQNRRQSAQRQADDLMRQAFNLLDTDPAKAATVAQESLNYGLHGAWSPFLIRLRQIAPDLADQLFQIVFAAVVRTSPPSLDGLLMLAPYALPMRGGEGLRVNADQARLFLNALATAFLSMRTTDANGEIRSPQQAARQLMLVGQFLPFFQRYLPEAVEPLQELMGRNSVGLPGNAQNKVNAASSEGADPVQSMLRTAESETNAEARDKLYAEAAMLAAGSGKTDRARAILQRIGNSALRDQVAQQVAVLGVTFMIEEQQWQVARQLASQIKESAVRADLLIAAGRTLVEKDQPEQATAFFNEALAVVTPLDASEEKVRVLMDLAVTLLRADRSRAYDIAQTAVTALNRLGGPTDNQQAEAKTTQITPRHLRRQLEAYFSTLGRADFERTLYVAMQLQNLEQRVVAQAVSCREALLVGEQKRKAKSQK